MIKKVVFILPHPYSHRDYKRFGGEILADNGFEVVFFDFSRLLAPLLWEKGVKKDRKKGAIVINTWEEAKDLISQFSKECFVFCMFVYRQKSFRIYRTLSQSKAPYAISATNAIPDRIDQSSQVERFLKRIPRITLSKLSVFFKQCAFRPIYAKYFGIRAPNILLAGGTKSLNYSQVALIGKKTEILWLHTMDYDIYLENLDNIYHARLKHHYNHEKAVFLDAPTPLFSRDNLVSGTECALTVEKFYPSLCKFFETLENQIGVTVEIAGHPGGDHAPYPECFGNRLTLHGQTFQMVMRSKVVIARDSSAINFAVLLNKPVIFISTDEAEACPELSNSIPAMAASLGKTPINIDHQFDINWDKELSIDEKAYSNYKKYFIKKDGSEELNSWQIVANRLKSM